MDVHHHHSSIEHKKWHHYFWEFFMLFLAVTLGYFVENMREHYVDHRKEMQYVRSYVIDMHEDLYQLDSLIKYNEYRNIMMDSLTYILNTPVPDVYGKQLYFYARKLTLTFPFYSTDRTIEQLKNGGNLRLIKKQVVSNSMMDYDRDLHFLENIRLRQEDYVRNYIYWMEGVFDGQEFNEMMSDKFVFTSPAFNPHLLKKDKVTLNTFITKIHFMKAANTFIHINLVKIRRTAKKTLDIIKQEYGVE